MSNAPAHEFGSTRQLSAQTPAKQLAIGLWRLACASCIAAATGVWRERALRRIERRSAVADSSFSRLRSDVMQVEARRLL